MKTARPLQGAPLSADTALDRLLAEAAPLPPENVSLPEAAGRVLAKEVRARLDSPPFTNSARDGYAVRAAETGGGVFLPLQASVFAGDAASALNPRHTVKVMTGAPLPPGADAVVMREDVAEEENGARFSRAAAPGDHVRPQGEDFRRGDVLLKPGTRLSARHIALLASQGLSEIAVPRRPRAALVVTGDELRFPGEPLGPADLYDSNGPALRTALESVGARVAGVLRAADDLESLTGALRRAAAHADVLLVTGGVSAGDRDHTRAAFAALGGEELFWRVAIRPGGPLAAARTPEGKFLFGLPGNPLSALVCFEVFVRPTMEVLQGLPAAPAFPLTASAANIFRKPAHLRQYVFARVEDGQLHIPPQGSALLKTAAQANALAVAPEGMEEVKPGEELSFRWL